MELFEPLQGPDVSERLRSSRGFGVTAATAPDAVPTIELTTDPAIHGARGQVSVRVARPDDGLRASFGACVRGSEQPIAAPLVARLQLGDRGLVQCASADSIRFWGRFGPAADRVVDSARAVRLVARTPAGDVLAGPVMWSGESRVTLTWQAPDSGR